MKSCIRCLLPDTYPGVTINDEGVCNHCIDYSPSESLSLGKEMLIRKVNAFTKAQKFDCVVPMSGGKDSCFILYYAVRELGLRPIAVSYDSGFQVAIAKENIRNACGILNVPFLHRESSEYNSKMLGESLCISAKIGYMYKYCGNCEAMIRMVAIQTAREVGAPMVFWGSSAMETFSPKVYEGYRKLGMEHGLNLSSKLSQLVSKVKVLVRDPWKISRFPKKIYPYIGYHAIRYNILSVLQRLKFGFPLRFALKPNSIPPFPGENPEFIHFFDYVPWNSLDNIRILEEEIDWKHPEGKISRFDCEIHSFANFHYLRSYGISHDGVNFSNFVRAGLMDRGEALIKEEQIKRSVIDECAALLQKIGMPEFVMP